MATNEIQLLSQRLKAEINVGDYHDAYTIDTAMQAVAIIFSENKGFPQCTPESKYKAVLSMITQGLNPLKGQCSFVPYGNQLQLLRDWSGSIMVAKREVKNIAAINSKVVRESDHFDLDIINGVYTILKHKPDVKNLNSPIIAAYAVAVGHDGKVIDADFMSYDDIKSTWKNAQLKYKGEPVVRQDGSIHPQSNHGKYPEKMTTKTVVHRLCRSIIKSSGNESIVEAADLDDEFVAAEPEPVEPQVIDFAPRQEPQATPEQADKIVEIAKQIGELDYMLIDVSSFVQRDIKKLRELTELEANRYIEMKLKSIVQQPPPDEPASDETPPWK